MRINTQTEQGILFGDNKVTEGKIRIDSSGQAYGNTGGENEKFLTEAEKIHLISERPFFMEPPVITGAVTNVWGHPGILSTPSIPVPILAGNNNNIVVQWKQGGSIIHEGDELSFLFPDETELDTNDLHVLSKVIYTAPNISGDGTYAVNPIKETNSNMQINGNTILIDDSTNRYIDSSRAQVNYHISSTNNLNDAELHTARLVYRDILVNPSDDDIVFFDNDAPEDGTEYGRILVYSPIGNLPATLRGTTEQTLSGTRTYGCRFKHFNSATVTNTYSDYSYVTISGNDNRKPDSSDVACNLPSPIITNTGSVVLTGGFEPSVNLVPPVSGSDITIYKINRATDLLTDVTRDNGGRDSLDGVTPDINFHPFYFDPINDDLAPLPQTLVQSETSGWTNISNTWERDLTDISGTSGSDGYMLWRLVSSIQRFHILGLSPTYTTLYDSTDPFTYLLQVKTNLTYIKNFSPIRNIINRTGISFSKTTNIAHNEMLTYSVSGSPANVSFDVEVEDSEGNKGDLVHFTYPYLGANPLAVPVVDFRVQSGIITDMGLGTSRKIKWIVVDPRGGTITNSNSDGAKMSWTSDKGVTIKLNGNNVPLMDVNTWYDLDGGLTGLIGDVADLDYRLKRGTDLGPLHGLTHTLYLPDINASLITLDTLSYKEGNPGDLVVGYTGPVPVNYPLSFKAQSLSSKVTVPNSYSSNSTIPYGVGTTNVPSLTFTMKAVVRRNGASFYRSFSCVFLDLSTYNVPIVGQTYIPLGTSHLEIVLHTADPYTDTDYRLRKVIDDYGNGWFYRSTMNDGFLDDNAVNNSALVSGWDDDDEDNRHDGPHSMRRGVMNIDVQATQSGTPANKFLWDNEYDVHPNPIYVDDLGDFGSVPHGPGLSSGYWNTVIRTPANVVPSRLMNRLFTYVVNQTWKVLRITGKLTNRLAVQVSHSNPSYLTGNPYTARTWFLHEPYVAQDRVRQYPDTEMYLSIRNGASWIMINHQSYANTSGNNSGSDHVITVALDPTREYRIQGGFPTTYPQTAYVNIRY